MAGNAWTNAGMLGKRPLCQRTSENERAEYDPRIRAKARTTRGEGNHNFSLAAYEPALRGPDEPFGLF
jgi:hypothetical protein